MSDKIRASFVFEILGRPPEYIKESLEKFIDKLVEQKGVEEISRVIHEPKPLEKNGEKIENMFTSFAEVEIFADNINIILAITLNMLPSHVEIIKPSEFNFKNFELSSLLSELTVKIHKYDELAKAIMIDRNNLIKKLKETEERIKELEKEIRNKEI